MGAKLIQSIENETTAYQWIYGYEIGPQLLYNLTETGLVIGCLMKYILNARQAGAEDLQTCREVLSRLPSSLA